MRRLPMALPAVLLLVLSGCSTFIMDPLFHDPRELLGDYGRIQVDLPRMKVSKSAMDLTQGFLRQEVDPTDEDEYSNYAELARQVATLTEATLDAVATNEGPTDVPVRYFVSQRDDLTAGNVAAIATAITTQTIPAGADQEHLSKPLTGNELDSIQDVLDFAADGEPFSFYVLAADGQPLDHNLIIHDITITSRAEAEMISTQ